jgi:hypothetical protein
MSDENNVQVLDPFDPAKLRLDQNFLETGGVKKFLVTVPVRKPGKQSFIRVHPNPDYRMPAAIIELKDDQEIYLVVPNLAHQIMDECTPVTLFTAMTRQGVAFLWPVKLPQADGRANEWYRSAAEAAGRAVDHWVRIKANMDLGAYEVFDASATIPDPVWPTYTYHELLRIAFRDRLVDRGDHPVLKRLRGEV